MASARLFFTKNAKRTLQSLRDDSDSASLAQTLSNEKLHWTICEFIERLRLQGGHVDGAKVRDFEYLGIDSASGPQNVELKKFASIEVPNDTEIVRVAHPGIIAHRRAATLYFGVGHEQTKAPSKAKIPAVVIYEIEI